MIYDYYFEIFEILFRDIFMAKHPILGVLKFDPYPHGFDDPLPKKRWIDRPV